ncbi:MAG TPA: PDZ domain-containing protein [Kribbellaceae bacterium]|jgi:PDZ domain-containing protein
MMRRGWTVLVGAVVLLALSVGLSYLPVPYVALGPGPTLDTLGKSDGKAIITISGRKTSTSEGHLNLTTVSVRDHIDLATALRFWIDGAVAVVPRELVYPPDQSEKQVEAENEQAFKASQTSAETAALRKLGFPVQVTIASLPDGSPSAGKLLKGDVVKALDGKPVTSQARLVELVRDHRIGETVTVDYLRNGKPGSVKVVTGGAGKGDQRRTVIGVSVEQKQPHPFHVSFDLDRIGGPSAGLMFALAVIDKLEPADLTGGTFIAGTGEIDDDGNVGPIGGIPQKMIAARDAGATIFLTPKDNCAEAVKTVPDGLRLVKVATLDDALESLRMLREKSGTPPTCPR